MPISTKGEEMEGLKIEAFDSINEVLGSIGDKFNLINIETEDLYSGIGMVEGSLQDSLKVLDTEYLLPLEVDINNGLQNGLNLVEGEIDNINKGIMGAIEGELKTISEGIINPLIGELEVVGNTLTKPMSDMMNTSIEGFTSELDSRIDNMSSSILGSAEGKINEVGQNLLGDFGGDIGSKVIGPLSEGFNTMQDEFMVKFEGELKGLGEKALGPVRDKMNEMGSKVAGKIGETFGSVQDNILKHSQGMLEGMKSKVMGPLQKSVGSFSTKVLTPLRGQIQTLGTKVIAKLSSYMTALVPVISSFAKATMGLMSNPIFLIAAGVTLLTLAIYDLWKGFNGGDSYLMPIIDKFLKLIGINKNFVEIINTVKDKFITFFELIKPLLSDFVDYFLNVKDLIVGIFTFDKEMIANSFEGILESLVNIKNQIFSLFDTFGEYIGEKLGQSAENIVSAVKGIIEGYVNYFLSLKDLIVGIFTLDKELIYQGLSGIVDSFKEIIENVKNLLVNFKGLVMEKFGGILEPILKPFKSAFAYIEEKVEKLTGIFDKVNNLTDNFSLSKGVDRVKGFFDFGKKEEVEVANVQVPNGKKENNINIAGLEMPINLPEGFSGDEGEFREKAARVMEDLWKNMMNRSYTQMVGE